MIKTDMNKVTKTLATICFYLILAALVSAIVSDIIILNQQIFAFIFSIVASVVVFIIAILLMIVSVILVFGAYALKDGGFWPLTWAINTFKGIMSDYQITQWQIDDLFFIRIILLVICVIALIIAIIAKVRIKKEKKKDPTIKVGHYRGFAIAGMILSILGTLASIGIAAILTSLR